MPKRKAEGEDLAVVETALPPSSNSSLLIRLRGLADRIREGVALWPEGGVAGGCSAPWLVVLCMVLGLKWLWPLEF